MSSAQPATTRTSPNGMDRLFSITARGSTVGREVRGGLVTFFTMAYIVVLNPIILTAGWISTVPSSAAIPTQPS
jgi:AGZA family xanthine/uracil permease-like MFS transporter